MVMVTLMKFMLSGPVPFLFGIVVGLKFLIVGMILSKSQLLYSLIFSMLTEMVVLIVVVRIKGQNPKG